MTRTAAPLLENDPGVKDAALVPASSAVSDHLVLMFERLAKDPAVDVDKLQRLIDMQKDILAHNARNAYNVAFSRMQPEIPAINEKGLILNKDRQSIRSRYARLSEDIHPVIKPILARHGFALRHRTEWPQDRAGIIRIVGILSHELGHFEESVFEAKADASDYRTDIQSQGSTVSYGRRYTTIDLLNISTYGTDDDGKKSGREQAPDPPQGFADWWMHINAVAAKGQKAFEAAWETSDGLYKNYAHKWAGDDLKALKLKAAGK